MAASNAYVVLKGGFALPVAPVLLLLDLEARGVRVFRDREDLVIEPWSRITDEDRDALRRWKPHLLALLSYESEAVQ